MMLVGWGAARTSIGRTEFYNEIFGTTEGLCYRWSWRCIHHT
jgi:hypothetical protein